MVSERNVLMMSSFVELNKLIAFHVGLPDDLQSKPILQAANYLCTATQKANFGTQHQVFIKLILTPDNKIP
jgi:hypothetical protein